LALLPLLVAGDSSQNLQDEPKKEGAHGRWSFTRGNSKEARRSVDTYFQNALAASQDSDCMNFELDLEIYESQDKRIKRHYHKWASEVFRKCKLIVLRNAFNSDLIERLKIDFVDQLEAYASGERTTGGSVQVDDLSASPEPVIVTYHQDNEAFVDQHNENLTRAHACRSTWGETFCVHELDPGAKIVRGGQEATDVHTN